MILTRRSLFVGAASLLAAPAIVRASSLMAVKSHSGTALYFDTDAEQFTRIYLRPGALNFAVPYPGWRFRVLPTGVLVHKPINASAQTPPAVPPLQARR